MKTFTEKKIVNGKTPKLILSSNSFFSQIKYWSHEATEFLFQKWFDFSDFTDVVCYIKIWIQSGIHFLLFMAIIHILNRKHMALSTLLLNSAYFKVSPPNEQPSNPGVLDVNMVGS